MKKFVIECLLVSGVRLDVSFDANESQNTVDSLDEAIALSVRDKVALAIKTEGGRAVNYNFFNLIMWEVKEIC